MNMNLEEVNAARDAVDSQMSALRAKKKDLARIAASMILEGEAAKHGMGVEDFVQAKIDATKAGMTLAQWLRLKCGRENLQGASAR